MWCQPSSNNSEEGFEGKRLDRTEAFKRTGRDPSKPSTLTAILRANIRSTAFHGGFARCFTASSQPGKCGARFAAIASVIDVTGSARSCASASIVTTTLAGSLSCPRSFCGDRNGQSVSTNNRSIGSAAAAWPQVLVLRIRDVAGEADPVAARRALARDLRVAAEAVDHDVLGRTLIQDSKDVGPRVADVDHHRLAGVVRQRDVHLEARS